MELGEGRSHTSAAEEALIDLRSLRPPGRGCVGRNWRQGRGAPERRAVRRPRLACPRHGEEGRGPRGPSPGAWASPRLRLGSRGREGGRWAGGPASPRGARAPGSGRSSCRGRGARGVGRRRGRGAGGVGRAPESRLGGRVRADRSPGEWAPGAFLEPCSLPRFLAARLCPQP